MSSNFTEISWIFIEIPSRPNEKPVESMTTSWDVIKLHWNFLNFHWNSMAPQWNTSKVYENIMRCHQTSPEFHESPLKFHGIPMKIHGIAWKFNENRLRASSSKGLINLSNTACGPGSDKKLPQHPGAPGDLPGGTRGVLWKFHGTSSIFTETSLKFHRNSMKIVKSHCSAMESHRFSLEFYGNSVSNQ